MRGTEAVAHLGELARSIVGSRLGDRGCRVGPGRRTRHRVPTLTGRKAYWTLDRPELLADLGSRRTGLSPEKAQARHYGPNRLADEHDVQAAALFVRQFASPLVLISSSAPASH